MQILNGSNTQSIDNVVEIGTAEFNSGQRNFTFNVTFNVSDTQYDDFGVVDATRDALPASLKGPDYVTLTNMLYVTFTAIMGNTRPLFTADIGLRYYNMTYQNLAFQSTNSAYN